MMKSTPLHCTESPEMLTLDHFACRLSIKRCQQVGYNGNVNIDSDKKERNKKQKR